MRIQLCLTYCFFCTMCFVCASKFIHSFYHSNVHKRLWPLFGIIKLFFQQDLSFANVYAFRNQLERADVKWAFVKLSLCLVFILKRSCDVLRRCMCA